MSVSSANVTSGPSAATAPAVALFTIAKHVQTPAVAPGGLTVLAPDGDTSKLAVSGGFFEVSNNQASVLADSVARSVGTG